MLKVGPLLRFLTDMNPQNTPPRLALCNWLRGFADPDETLTPRLFERFLWDCLDYPHWATNRTQLGSELRSTLEHFNSFYQQRMDLRDIRFPETIQIIELEQNRDVQEVLSSHLRQSLPPEASFRIRFDGKQNVLAFVLNPDRTLEVRCFDRKFTLRDGILEPLRQDLTLFYDAELNIAEDCQHKIEIAPYVTAQFTISKGRVRGVCLRGFVFQKMLEFKGEMLSEVPRLQMPIRRIEQFFIDRTSDTQYQDLVQKLERTRALIRAGDVEARRWAPTILTQAETALEQVYTQDRLLALLARELRYDLQNQGGREVCPPLTPIIESDLTN